MQSERMKPGPGQESVWDYPRPPACEPTARRIRVVHAAVTIADTSRAYRVLETSHPPVYYLPPEDVRMDLLEASPGRSFCEWKGEAGYFDLVMAGQRIERVAWHYPRPTKRFSMVAGYLAFYASRVEACYVDDEQARPQAGDFYGSWITHDVVGPFKGGPGTMGW